MRGCDESNGLPKIDGERSSRKKSSCTRKPRPLPASRLSGTIAYQCPMLCQPRLVSHTGEQAAQASVVDRQRTRQAANLLRDGVRQGHGGDGWRGPLETHLQPQLAARSDQTIPKPYLVSRGGVRYQIGCQMGIEGVHGHLIAGIGTKADEPVGPHEDGPTIGNVRHLVELRRIDDCHKSFPALAKIVQTRRIVRHDKMVGRTAKVVACSETDSSS
jgi:hypothetical protein